MQKHIFNYSQCSKIRTPKIRAPPSTRQLICPFYVDVAEIVGSMVSVAYYSLCIYIAFYMDKSELRAP